MTVWPPRIRWTALAVHGLVAANILTLWLRRGAFVGGWELFGATFGALALNEGSFATAVHTIFRALLDQSRPVWTGGESFIYGLVPGALDTVMPWLLWSELLALALFLALSFWLIRVLPCRSTVYWACVLASPALTSYTIVGYPYLTSTAIPYGMAIGYVLYETRRERPAWSGALLDVGVLAAVAFIAFNGYESGKTFFLVPAVGAFTLRGISLPRRLSWLVWSTAIAWLVSTKSGGSIHAALGAVSPDAGAIARAVVASVRGYALDWYVDFPALACAALVSLLLPQERRAFWAVLLAAVLGLVCLNAFYLDGAFVIPHRFLLLGFVSALIVSVTLSERRTGAVVLSAWALVVTGMAYTTYQTVRFVVTRPADLRGPWVGQFGRPRVYPLPYHRAKLDWFVRPEYVRDAEKLVAAVRAGTEVHVVLYGFSVSFEDSVNPQLFVSRVLLPLGYSSFTRRVHFFDHLGHMYFQFPVKPLPELARELRDLRPPFFVHIREPEYSSESVLAAYFNRAKMVPVDVGFETFKSYRVEEFAPAGPIPVRALDREDPGEPPTGLATYRPGFCLTRAEAPQGRYIPLVHPGRTLPERLSGLLGEMANRQMVRRFVDTPGETFRDGDGVAVFLAYFRNEDEKPKPMKLRVSADDELAATINDQTIIESFGPKPSADYAVDVLLPYGLNVLRIAYHKYYRQGGVTVLSTDEAGQRFQWRCDPHFG